MQLVKTSAPVTVKDANDQPVYQLEPHQTYALYDCETAAAMRSETVQWVATLDSQLRSYAGQALTSERLVLPFIGRLGDALITAACLQALRDRYPNVSIDIACLPLAKEVFELSPSFGKLLPYPIRADCLKTYQYHLSFEDIASVKNATQRTMFDLLSHCLNTRRPTSPATLAIPESAKQRCKLPKKTRPRVAIHVGEPHSLRTYPIDQTINLANELSESDVKVILFGSPSAPTSGFDTELSPQIQNYIGKTKSVSELAATLAQTDIVITGDSFPLHLAAALNIRTVALFAPTSPTIVSDYKNVTAIKSQAKCSPCGVAFGACPLAHATCIAHNDESLAPKRIATNVISLIREPAQTI